MKIKDDIVTAIAQTLYAFHAVNLEPPIVIYLANQEQGRVVTSMLSDHTYHTPLILISFARVGAGDPVDNEPEFVFMEVEVMGVKIRWPAKRIAMTGGGYRFV